MTNLQENVLQSEGRIGKQILRVKRSSGQTLGGADFSVRVYHGSLCTLQIARKLALKIK